MLSDIAPAKANCKTQTDKVMALGQKLHVNGTPNLIFANGVQAPGFLSAEELERNLNGTKAD
jgi:thiol:disulfide interchange protein DsbC